jgi:hypothetical protein
VLWGVLQGEAVARDGIDSTPRFLETRPDNNGYTAIPQLASAGATDIEMSILSAYAVSERR